MAINNTKNRIRAISRATGRAYADSKRIWELIKNNEVKHLLSAQLELSAETFTLDFNGYYFEFRSINYLHHDNETFYEYFLQEIENKSDGSLIILNSRNVYDILQKAEQDYSDRVRISELYPDQKFQHTMYILDESTLKNAERFKSKVNETIEYFENYQNVGIHLLFVGKDNHPYASFPENIVPQLSAIDKGRSALFNLSNETAFYRKVDVDGSVNELIVEHFSQKFIPKFAKYNDIKKATPKTFALGLGMYGEQINWGHHKNNRKYPSTLNTAPHAMIQGGLNSGISVINRTIASQAVEAGFDVRVFNPLENAYKNIPEVQVSNKVNTILDNLQKVRHLIDERYTILAREGLLNWMDFEDYNDTKIILIIEEIQQFTEYPRIEYEFERILWDISRRGRAAGIHLVLTGKDFSFLTGELKANIGIRIMCGNPAPHEDRLFFGKEDSNSPYKSEINGRARIRTYGSDIEEFQMFFKPYSEK